jgi:polyhydroxyalkanoate synthesis regulator phasin
MDEPGSEQRAGGEHASDERVQEERATSFRDLAEKALLTGLGLLAAAKDKAEEVVGGDEGPGLAERAKSALSDLADDVGLIRREQYEELELKVAQLEHRVRLLEERLREPPPAA